MSPKCVFCSVNRDTRQLLLKAQASTDEGGEVAVCQVTGIRSLSVLQLACTLSGRNWDAKAVENSPGTVHGRKRAKRPLW